MLAVKNSMKRRLVRSPRSRMMAGSASSPARTSAGGGVSASVSRIGGFGIS
jgi:hypothetical protein